MRPTLSWIRVVVVGSFHCSSFNDFPMRVKSIERLSSHPLRREEGDDDDDDDEGGGGATTCPNRVPCHVDTQRFCDKEYPRFIAAYKDKRTALKRLHSIVRHLVGGFASTQDAPLTTHRSPYARPPIEPNERLRRIRCRTRNSVSSRSSIATGSSAPAIPSTRTRASSSTMWARSTSRSEHFGSTASQTTTSWSMPGS